MTNHTLPLGPALIAAFFGFAVAGILFWFFSRKKPLASNPQVAANDQIEIARLTERLASLSIELNTSHSQLNEFESRALELQTQLETIRDERARLEERVTRVATLEADLAECRSQLTSLRQENIRAAAQLAERTNALESSEHRLALEQGEHHADREALDSLRGRLQEETNRVASLTEQNSRLPELERLCSERTAECNQAKQQLADIRERLGISTSTTEALSQRIAHLQSELTELISKRDRLQTDQETLKTQLAEVSTALDAERKHNIEKLALLEEAKEQLADRFKSLANDILEEKAQRFTEQNKTNISQILEPLKVKLQEFHSKVEEVYVQEGKDRSALAEQVRQLMSLNNQLSEEAHNLTKALKGSGKAQGNWGELILERVLELSGLRKGHEYDVRETVAREDGSRAQPDVVVHLPDGKQLVVDAKVSLIAYEEYANADSDVIRAAAIARHLESVRTHIKQLSHRNYQMLYELKSLDFVIMFVPVEPAFILAISNDAHLWEQAWDKNVLLVSPSTLLFVVRTVAHLWRQQDQNRNVQEIAKRGAELYDKLVGFVTDFTHLGERLTQAKDSYDNAYGKLSRGRGNLIRKAETLKDLGVTPTKSLPEKLVESAFDDSFSLPALASSEDT
jgi:DNA recombination protein RmuC